MVGVVLVKLQHIGVSEEPPDAQINPSPSHEIANGRSKSRGNGATFLNGPHVKAEELAVRHLVSFRCPGMLF